MVLCRCLEKHAWPKGKMREYIAYVKPIGYPNTSIICGKPICNYPAVIWLDNSEIKAYQEGQRIFSVPTCSVQVKADDSGVFKEII